MYNLVGILLGLYLFYRSYKHYAFNYVDVVLFSISALLLYF